MMLSHLCAYINKYGVTHESEVKPLVVTPAASGPRISRYFRRYGKHCVAEPPVSSRIHSRFRLNTARGMSCRMLVLQLLHEHPLGEDVNKRIFKQIFPTKQQINCRMKANREWLDGQSQRLLEYGEGSLIVTFLTWRIAQTDLAELQENLFPVCHC